MFQKTFECREIWFSSSKWPSAFNTRLKQSVHVGTVAVSISGWAASEDVEPAGVAGSLRALDLLDQNHP